MPKVAAISSPGEGVRLTAATAEQDRRRLVRLARGTALLFLLPLLYALFRSEPVRFESRPNYAFVAGSYAGDDVRLDAAKPAAAPVAAVAPAKPAKVAAETRAPEEHSTYYCDFYAQAVIGNTRPEQAARREQTNGAVMGALGGAMIGVLFGGGNHYGRKAALGAGAGLLAGVTVGSGYARRAADDLRRRYDAAYAMCMNPAPARQAS